ncbi:MAG TPA: preprotein translocase subunit SecE [Thermoclostridium sp.]|nr:preprotein translocase subunit SecE [Thermoclostridium sp.]
MAEQVKKKPNIFIRFLKFVKEIRSELKKVIWPTKSQLLSYTLTVVFVCLLVGGIVWIFDALFGFLYTLIFA